MLSVDRLRLLLCAACLSCLMMVPAAAQHAEIDIPAESLKSALDQLIRQSGLQLLYNETDIEGLKSNAVQGEDPLTVLNAMLKGSGVSARRSASGAFVVARFPQHHAVPTESDVRNAAASVEQVIVSSTRVMRGGYSAPTSTTVMSAIEIARSAQANIFTVLNQLPFFAGGTGILVNNNATSTGITGLSALSLRGLGTDRTLVLIDGQRIVAANPSGAVDISQIPQAIIARVDVVTGGASASWGSDAVAGVVNFVTDKKFTGIKLNVSAGMTTYGDDGNVAIQSVAGTSFAQGRGHVEVSLDYGHQDGVGPAGFGITGRNGRDWYRAPGLLQRTIADTPPGQPQYIFATNVASVQFAKYGLITAGPLKGIAFGAHGSPYDFQYGSPIIHAFMVGGDTSGNVGNGASLMSSLTRGVLYGRVSYHFVGMDIFLSGQLSEVRTSNVPNIGAFKNANLIIQCDNPFLPMSIVRKCATNGITSFQYGTANAQFQNDVTVTNMRRLERVVLGVSGSSRVFGRLWKWNGHVTHGTNNFTTRVANVSLTPRYNAAIDAVVGPDGTPVCRSAVARVGGCVPLNIIGDNPVDPDAMSYIFPQHGPVSVTAERQEVINFNVNGTPFSDWAGAVSVAFGIEYREEAYHVTGDPYSVGNGGDPLLSSNGDNWYAGNFHSGTGNYHALEGFLEMVVPLMRSKRWGGLDIDLAGRATSYSTSGYINTWKAGLTYDTPLPGLHLRVLQSRDARAANLGELFQAVTVSNGTVFDDFTGQGITIQNVATGNANLKPERSATTEIGFSYRPDWLDGLDLSLGYYRTDIRGGIVALTAQQVLDLCFFQNDTPQCNAIVYNGGAISQIVTRSFNVSSIVTDGFDLDAGYTKKLSNFWLTGNVTLRLLATRVSKFITNTGIVGQAPIESGGVNATTFGGNNGLTAGWKWMATQTYDNDDWSISLTENWISDGVISRRLTACSSTCPPPTADAPTINNNRISGAFYLAVGGSYTVAPGLEAYFKVDNLTDRAPPLNPAIVPNNNGSNPHLFDTVGRMYRIGLRFSR